MTFTPPARALSVDEMQEHFAPRSGYLSACMVGVPPRSATEALGADLVAWSEGHRDPGSYGPAVERSREAFALLVGIPSAWVATGSQVSATAGVVAASLPLGAEVLVVDGDFSSIVFPFLVQERLGRITVRSVPLERLATSVRAETALVAFSLVQSATGRLADADAIASAAERHGAATFCDTTQACGWMPVHASLFDITVCHAYKWLGCPRGASFTTVRPASGLSLEPILAGWYAGDSVWDSCYGPEMALAPDARRFDLSPAWPVWVGAAPALELFASADLDEVRRHCIGLADAFRARLRAAGREASGDGNSAIVTWADPNGSEIASLTEAGVAASSRAGRCRVAFHVWNTAADLELAARAIGIGRPRPASDND
jgi:selenocysteine lyase/cysteine desulfurase